MIHGVDTSFLIAVTQPQHPVYAHGRLLLERTISAKGKLALTPQVLAEFLHIITDGNRFESPLTMARACELVDKWWRAAEVVQVFPDAASVKLCLEWMREHRLGRKRILDTMLAATFSTNAIASVLTLNERDFRTVGGFAILSPRG